MAEIEIMLEKLRMRVHATVDEMGDEAQMNKAVDVAGAYRHIHNAASWHMRSTGQIRRFEAAKYKKGDCHG